MGQCWRNPIELPRHWQVTLSFAEVACPIGLGIIPFFVGKDAGRDWWLIALAIFLSAISLGAMVTLRTCDWIGNADKRYVDCLLERLGEEIWKKSPDKLNGPREQHRITLFQLKRRGRIKRFWSKIRSQTEWTHVLRPCTRLPRSGRRPRRSFRVHDHYIQNCEGVAGLIFAKGHRSLVSEELPDLHGPTGVSTELLAEYARLTNDEPAVVEKERYYSRVIGGVTIYRGGVRWGVLILDSSDPDAFTIAALDGVATKRILSVLSDVLSS